jgi:hypothetical protein
VFITGSARNADFPRDYAEDEERWAYPGVGSSTPPAWYPSAR